MASGVGVNGQDVGKGVCMFEKEDEKSIREKDEGMLEGDVLEGVVVVGEEDVVDVVVLEDGVVGDVVEVEDVVLEVVVVEDDGEVDVFAPHFRRLFS